MIQSDEKRTAVLSDDQRYRYTLRIVWDAAKPIVQMIGLNPSTATAEVDDPTLRRVKRFARDWGMGGLVMTNLFALRSTDPKALYTSPDPIGETINFTTVDGKEFSNRNDLMLHETSVECAQHVACWGTHGDHLFRAAKVRLAFPRPLYCFDVTANGFPKHPLYVKAENKPKLYCKL